MTTGQPELTIGGWVALLDPSSFSLFDLTEQWVSEEGAIEGGPAWLEACSDLNERPSTFWIGRVCEGDPTRTGASIMKILIIDNVFQVKDGKRVKEAR